MEMFSALLIFLGEGDFVRMPLNFGRTERTYTHTITDKESLSHSLSIYFFLFLSLSLPPYLDWAHSYTLIVPFFFRLSCV